MKLHEEATWIVHNLKVQMWQRNAKKKYSTEGEIKYFNSLHAKKYHK